ncbi:RES family NAD+ phosphorylase [Chromohalobacter israelensis]|uniref:RES family NAD+ phosphorylase n=1 Tax=Chromohalobacter israelensis TaxID=141390 RepID=UPI001CC69EE5|nr:RES domain-containing protein [Chromohalobacter salexigens]MBZ5876655.1 RES domain-containing protein [Chromohalobacter salexigens]
MIQRLRFETGAYRVHVPRWAFAPTSGAGAGEHGGRLNRPGVPALYLALEEATALAEYKQLSSLMPPGLIVSYEVRIRHVVDFSRGYNEDWDEIWQELHCDWHRLWFNDHIEPPSWLLGDIALAAGSSGILFPSQANPAGTNLVIYPESLEEGDMLKVHDPNGLLPKDSSSWE